MYRGIFYRLHMIRVYITSIRITALNISENNKNTLSTDDSCKIIFKMRNFSVSLLFVNSSDVFTFFSRERMTIILFNRLLKRLSSHTTQQLQIYIYICICVYIYTLDFIRQFCNKISKIFNQITTDINSFTLNRLLS